MYIIRGEICYEEGDEVICSKKMYIDNFQKAELETWLIDSGFKKQDDSLFTRDHPFSHLTELVFFKDFDDSRDRKIRKIKDIKRDLDLEKYRRDF
ncbi:hypothetical protein IKD57_01540 [Candidatus Saccharibacteria bacterium]|nr:hypothetical protein [Candidatus Saccharibacteria bacterium]